MERSVDSPEILRAPKYLYYKSNVLGFSMLNRGQMYPFDLIYDIIITAFEMLLITMVSSIYKLSENLRIEKDEKCFKLGNEKRSRKCVEGGWVVSVSQ